MFNLEMLSAIEEIKQLKSRYFHYVDTRQWDLLEALFTEDCSFEIVDANLKVEGRKAFIDMQRRGTSATISVHQGHDPEIEILTDDSAKARWSLHDFAKWPDEAPLKGKFTTYHGYGHYYETYRKTQDGWRINSWRVVHSASNYA